MKDIRTCKMRRNDDANNEDIEAINVSNYKNLKQ